MKAKMMKNILANQSWFWSQSRIMYFHFLLPRWKTTLAIYSGLAPHLSQ